MLKTLFLIIGIVMEINSCHSSAQLIDKPKTSTPISGIDVFLSSKHKLETLKNKKVALLTNRASLTHERCWREY